MPGLTANLKFLGLDREVTENALRPGRNLTSGEYGFKVSYHASGEGVDESVRRYHYFTTDSLGTRAELEQEFAERLVDEYLANSNLELNDIRLEMGWKG
jgi:hypothetical protein